jgi:c-di-GMP-binding flagellar brake protein YcgR
VSQERRRYFRIDDYFEVRFQVLERAEPRTATRFQTTVRESVDELRNKSRLLLNRIRIGQREVGELLELVEQRLRRLEDLVPDDETRLPPPSERQELAVAGINISACGAAFWSPIELQDDTRLRLVMTFMPDDLRVTTAGRVVGCERSSVVKDSDHPFVVRVDFHDMHPDAQEVLVQHMLKRQSSQLRAAREARER